MPEPSSRSADFAPPNWDAPLDTRATIDAVPGGATTKGMFFTDLLRQAEKHGVSVAAPEASYTVFRDYPLRDYLQLAVDVAKAIHPHASTRQGLRLLGRSAYPTMLESTIGRVIFGVLGKDVPRILAVAGKGYKVALNHGTVTTVESTPTYVITRLEGLYSFLDSLQVGVFEGAIIACDAEPDVQVRWLSETAIEFRSTWRWHR